MSVTQTAEATASGAIATPRERPILFSGEMVRAILEGRKTQTRRVIKPQPELQKGVPPHGGDWWCFDGRTNYERTCWERGEKPFIRDSACTYGVAGDRLWVRETWAGDDLCGVCYRADHPNANLKRGDMDDGELSIRSWRPSIFMPRWAARITLEVTGVRVERVQEISEIDAMAEGVPDYGDGTPFDYRWGYHMLWDGINAKRGYGWEANPWVWAISFRWVKALERAA